MVVSLLAGLIPIIWLVIALAVLKMPGYKACGISVAIAAVIAIIYKNMSGQEAGSAVLEGVFSALWPIILVIIAALFMYNVTLKTGAMDKIKRMLAMTSCDKRILALIIGWCFGCFMEGMAGFGTAVAIPASILVALGFEPVPVVLGLLICNSTPTAFGSVGVPTISLASATGLGAGPLSADYAIISIILMFVSPFIYIMVIGKSAKALKGILPIVTLSSLTFVIPDFIIARTIGPELPNIIGSICSLIVTVLFALKTKNRPIPEQYRIRVSVRTDDIAGKLTLKEAAKAWSPFLLTFVFLLFTSNLFPAVNSVLSSVRSSFLIYTGADAMPTTFIWINTAGIWIILAAVIGGRIQGASFPLILKTFLSTVKNNVKMIITICSVLATAKIMVHSGMISDISNALILCTKRYFPLFAPLVGVLGGFVTGSGTNTGVLFGPLQASAAQQLQMAPEWLCGANSLGAGIGKMISPSNVAIACTSAGIAGKESRVIGGVFKYALLFAAAGGVICFLGTL